MRVSTSPTSPHGRTLRAERVAKLLHRLPVDTRGLERREGHALRGIELAHDHEIVARALQELTYRGDVDLALAERAVPLVVRSPVEVLHVDVAHRRQQVLDHLHRVRPALLKLTDVGTKLHVPCIDRL